MRKYFVVCLAVFVLLSCTSCGIKGNDVYVNTGYSSAEHGFDINNEASNEQKNDSFINIVETTEALNSISSSCYWLPVSYICYSENGVVKNETQWEYDEYGFVKSITNNGELWDYMIPEFDGNILYIFFDESDRSRRLQYNYDDEGNLISCSYNTFNRDMYTVGEEGNIEKYLWLDAKGKILQECEIKEIFYYPNETVGGYMMEKDDWYYDNIVQQDEECNSVIASVWKNGKYNSDGSVTTTLYYESGKVGEIIEWIPVTKQGYLQNMVYNNDWDYGGTLELFYRGR